MTEMNINDQLMKSIANPARLRDESLIDPFETRQDPSNDLIFDLSASQPPPSVIPVLTPVPAGNPFHSQISVPVQNIRKPTEKSSRHHNIKKNHHRHHRRRHQPIPEEESPDDDESSVNDVNTDDDDGDVSETGTNDGAEQGGTDNEENASEEDGTAADTESSYEHRKSRTHRSKHHRSSRRHDSDGKKRRHKHRHHSNRVSVPAPTAPIEDDFDTFKQANYHQDENLEKMGLLNKIAQIEKDGGRSSNKLTAFNTIDELRYELYRMTREQSREKAIESMEKGLVTGVRMLEMANKKFDPIGVQLQGFSRTVLLEMDNYRPSLLAIYSKYGNSRASTSNPVIQILFTLLSSLLFHHVSVVSQKEAEANSKMTNTGKILQSLAGKSVPINPFSQKRRTGAATRPQVSMTGPPDDSDDD
jgi:hypothetical protein